MGWVGGGGVGGRGGEEVTKEGRGRLWTFDCPHIKETFKPI